MTTIPLPLPSRRLRPQLKLPEMHIMDFEEILDFISRRYNSQEKILCRQSLDSTLNFEMSKNGYTRSKLAETCLCFQGRHMMPFVLLCTSGRMIQFGNSTRVSGWNILLYNYEIRGYLYLMPRILQHSLGGCP